MSDEKQESIVKANDTAIVPDHRNLRSLAMDLLKSGLFGQVKSVEGAITVIEYGRELGIPPVAALQTMAIVQGKLCMEAKAMLALFQNHGGKTKIVERSKTRCQIEFSKPGMEPYAHEYTIEHARAEKLDQKDNWKKMPETMLFWRCVATGIRAYDPGAIFGLYSKEELVDYSPQNTQQGGQSSSLSNGPMGMGPDVKNKQTADMTRASAPPQPQNNDVIDAIVEEPDNSFSLEPLYGDDPYNPSSKIANDPLKDDLVRAIKEALKAEDIDEKRFKVWLLDYQFRQKPTRKYVGMKFGNPSMGEGDANDLKHLHSNMKVAITKYRSHK